MESIALLEIKTTDAKIYLGISAFEDMLAAVSGIRITYPTFHAFALIGF